MSSNHTNIPKGYSFDNNDIIIEKYEDFVWKSVGRRFSNGFSTAMGPALTDALQYVV